MCCRDDLAQRRRSLFPQYFLRYFGKNVQIDQGDHKKIGKTVQFTGKVTGDLLKVLIESGRPAGTSGQANVPVRITYKGLIYGAEAGFIIKGTAKGFSGK